MIATPQTRPRRLAQFAIATVIATLAMTLAQSSADAAVPRSFYGVVPQTPLNDNDFDRMGQGRVGTLRVPLSWGLIDPSAAADDYDWSGVDPVVEGAARNGVEVLPFFFGTPDWVAKDLDGYNCGADCATFAPKSPAAIAAFGEFVRAAVQRYGPAGSFWDENPTVPKLPITAWQIWNEQNSREFYAPKQNPKAYATLLETAAAEVRAVDGSAQVVLGGMAQLAGSNKATKASKYLTKLYKVRRIKNLFEGVAIHPYGASVDKVAAQVELFREVMKEGGDRRAGLWVTELGWGSDKGGNPLNRGSKGQADRLKEAFKYFRKQRRKYRIETVNWFSWMDSAASICDWCAASGLFKAGLVEKPSWRAFTKFTGGS